MHTMLGPVLCHQMPLLPLLLLLLLLNHQHRLGHRIVAVTIESAS